MSKIGILQDPLINITFVLTLKIKNYGEYDRFWKTALPLQDGREEHVHPDILCKTTVSTPPYTGQPAKDEIFFDRLLLNAQVFFLFDFTNPLKTAIEFTK